MMPPGARPGQGARRASRPASPGGGRGESSPGVIGGAGAGILGAMAARIRLTLLAGLLVAGLARAAAADTHAVKPFFGRYEGTAVSGAEGELDTRDVRAEILPQDKGFAVKWVVVTKKADGRVKRDDTTIAFLPSPRPGIYASAMRRDVFGNAVPMDPMRGDPYVWARVEGTTLKIYALIVTDGGGFEMHVYERTLTPTGLSLKFSRVVDGRVLRTVTGSLRKLP